MSQMGEVARKTRKTAGKAASSIAAEANEQVRNLADQQLGLGADLIDDVAAAMRAAADSLDENVGPLARLVRDTADRVEDFSDSVRRQSAGSVMDAAADFARRRPAVLLGAAAASGFILYRLLNAGRTDSPAEPSGEARTAEARTAGARTADAVRRGGAGGGE